MGIYLNDVNDLDGSKKCILDAIKSLTPVNEDYIRVRTPAKGRVWLFLLDNYDFKALGVLYSSGERDYLVSVQDGRPKRYFEADIAEIKQFVGPRAFEDIRFGQEETTP